MREDRTQCCKRRVRWVVRRSSDGLIVLEFIPVGYFWSVIDNRSKLCICFRSLAMNGVFSSSLSRYQWGDNQVVLNYTYHHRQIVHDALVAFCKVVAFSIEIQDSRIKFIYVFSIWLCQQVSDESPKKFKERFVFQVTGFEHREIVARETSRAFKSELKFFSKRSLVLPLLISWVLFKDFQSQLGLIAGCMVRLPCPWRLLVSSCEINFLWYGGLSHLIPEHWPLCHSWGNPRIGWYFDVPKCVPSQTRSSCRRVASLFIVFLRVTISSRYPLTDVI